MASSLPAIGDPCPLCKLRGFPPGFILAYSGTDDTVFCGLSRNGPSKYNHDCQDVIDAMNTVTPAIVLGQICLECSLSNPQTKRTVEMIDHTQNAYRCGRGSDTNPATGRMYTSRFHAIVSGASPASSYGLASGQALSNTGYVAGLDPGYPAAYHVEEKKLTLADFFPAPPPKKHIDEYPHRCPKCGKRAYVGLFEISHIHSDYDAECKRGSLASSSSPSTR